MVPKLTPLGSKIIVDSDYGHEIISILGKKLLGKKL